MAAKTMDDIALLMKQLKFKKKLFGGVKEMDVWRKLELLHQQYQSNIGQNNGVENGIGAPCGGQAGKRAG